LTVEIANAVFWSVVFAVAAIIISLRFAGSPLTIAHARLRQGVNVPVQVAAHFEELPGEEASP
jgi:hypothetical protein